jgi:hypothetical protein
MNARIDTNKQTLTIELPLVRQNSKSGKTILVATTHGNVPSTCIVDGKPVVVSVNAYIKP